EESAHREWRHEAASKLFAGKRRIGDRWPVAIRGAAPHVAESFSATHGRKLAFHGEPAVERVRVDYRRNVQEYGGVRVPDLEEVLQHLSLPRLRDRHNVVEAI